MNAASPCSDVPNRADLPDHASEQDDRQLAIDRVGIAGLSWPITVWDRAQKEQPTVAVLDATVTLPAHQKGTHMSRFIEVLNAVRGELSLKTLPSVVTEIQRRLEAERAQLVVRFPYFVTKKAPVSGIESLLEVRCAFHARKDGDTFDFLLEVTVPVTTLCPCSKAISRYGAHNQRSSVKVELRGDAFVWIEEVVETVEACASAPVYTLLKREDEKFVTEQAYDNPRFVEDMIREVVTALQPKASWLRVTVENFESIHNHSAWATMEWPCEAPSPCAPPVPVDHAAPQTFGAWLRQQRAQHGWHQGELAAAMGISTSLLSKIEAGSRALPPQCVAPLAGHLGVDPQALSLRAGVLSPELLARIQADPERFLAWARQPG